MTRFEKELELANATIAYQEARNRLRDAAPELTEALHGVLGCLEARVMREDARKAHTRIARTMCKNARAALAKAGVE